MPFCHRCTNTAVFHRICEARTLGNSLNVGLMAGYLSVRTAEGTSDRRWMKARLINGLTYLLLCLLSGQCLKKCCGIAVLTVLWAGLKLLLQQEEMQTYRPGTATTERWMVRRADRRSRAGTAPHGACMSTQCKHYGAVRAVSAAPQLQASSSVRLERGRVRPSAPRFFLGRFYHLRRLIRDWLLRWSPVKRLAKQSGTRGSCMSATSPLSAVLWSRRMTRC